MLDIAILAYEENQSAVVVGWYGSKIPVDGYIRKGKSLYGTHCKKELNGMVNVHRGDPMF